MLKKWMLALLLLALTLSSALAMGSAMPAEVERHIGNHFPGYDIFDYLEIEGTPEGTFGFALLSKGREKLLAGYHEENGKMSYWLKTATAVPQGAGISKAEYDKNPGKRGDVFLLERHPEFDVRCLSGQELVLYGDELGFNVINWNSDVDEFFELHQVVSYHWEDGGFKLTGYRNDDIQYGPVYVRENQLDFYRGEWEYEGTAHGVIQRDIRYASLDAMPKTLAEAKEKLTLPPDLPDGLSAQKVRFEGGKKYPVYTGPGEDYTRSGNGKGLVSTNDWIQVFGEENGWIMIQYDISAEKLRIGWIEASALPKNAKVETMTWGNWTEAVAVRDTPITDDPIVSRAQVGTMREGERCTWLATLGSWAYVEVQHGNEKLRGFVTETDNLDIIREK